VIGTRSFGADPALVARHTAAWVRGLQSTGVGACAKHYPGHGNTSVDSHHAAPRIGADRAELFAVELAPFRAAIAAGVQAIMSAHLFVPAIDPDFPATLSRALLIDLLRGELGFEGLIVTDAIEMTAVAGPYGLGGAAVRALAAGADAICVGGETADEEAAVALRDAVVDAVAAGALPEERLADAAARVARLARWTADARREIAAPAPALAAVPASTPIAGRETVALMVAPPGASHNGGNGQRANGNGNGNGSGTGKHTNGVPLGLTAARRAVHITTANADQSLLPLTAAAHVVEFGAAVNMAIGSETPWGVGEPLARLLPGTTTVRLTADAQPDATRLGEVALAPAEGRPLVVVVRDVHRHPWMARALHTLLAARPDTIVVEMGVPATRAGEVHLATYGASRANGQAAAEALAGR
jgi:beta-N-acetylhexosaminidase